MRVFACVLLVLVLLPATAEAALRVETVSTRPEMVTGGDVLVRVSGVNHAKVTVDGRDVSRAFRAGDGGLIGLVDGLSAGEHQLTATSGGDTARLKLTNHPITGPVFSGP